MSGVCLSIGDFDEFIMHNAKACITHYKPPPATGMYALLFLEAQGASVVDLQEQS